MTWAGLLEETFCAQEYPAAASPSGVKPFATEVSALTEVEIGERWSSASMATRFETTHKRLSLLDPALA